MKFDFTVSSEIAQSTRVKQLSAMFDVPAQKKSELRFKGELPLDSQEWNVGLIVGPSGCGKSSILKTAFDAARVFDWQASSVIDDFDKSLSMQTISEVCQAVGFNTIPAWMRPFRVLSNGEQFRVLLARHLLENDDPIVMDEFTSVVDRQVAKIGSHAVQKYIRRNKRKFVAASCHYDIADWLQPDWIYEPATNEFQWRSLRRRPALNVSVTSVSYAAWRIFAPFHYLTAELHRAARCFALFVEDRIASFAGMLHRPHPRVKDIQGCSRLVTLPDYQGLGLAMILIEKVSAAYKAIGKRVHTYPAHPALIRSFDKSSHWSLEKRPGLFAPRDGATSSIKGTVSKSRPCAVFSYCGEAMELSEARRLLCV